MIPEEISSWELFLVGIPIFSGLPKAELRKIAQKIQLLSLPKGATLFRQGDEPEDLFIIASGLVRVVHLRGSEEIVDAFLGRGETLGEGGVLTGERRTATRTTPTVRRQLGNISTIPGRWASLHLSTGKQS